MDKIVKEIEEKLVKYNLDFSDHLNYLSSVSPEDINPILGNIRPIILNIWFSVYGNDKDLFYSKHPFFDKYEDDKRNQSSKMLKNRLINIFEDYVYNNHVDEDYFLKTIYGLYRHFFEYKSSDNCLDNEAYLFYISEMIQAYNRILYFVKFEDITDTKYYVCEDAEFGVYYQMLVDVCWNVFEGLPKGYDEYNVFFGYDNSRYLFMTAAPHTNVRSYYFFRENLNDYEYYIFIDDDDPYWQEEDYKKKKEMFSLPRYKINEDDNEIFKFYTDIPNLSERYLIEQSLLYGLGDFNKPIKDIKVCIIPDGTKIVTKDLIKEADIYILPASIEEFSSDVFSPYIYYPWTMLYTGTIAQFKKIKSNNIASVIYCADGIIVNDYE